MRAGLSRLLNHNTLGRDTVSTDKFHDYFSTPKPIHRSAELDTEN